MDASCLNAASPSNEAVPEDWLRIEPLREGAQATMDRDRRLFEQAKQSSHAPILRFYRWAEPTLSYGRTQGLPDAARDAYTKQGYALVQRPTGGGLVVHGEDLCFTLIWRREHRTLPWRVTESYCAIHGWLQKTLAGLGFPCALAPEPGAEGDQKAWCFRSPVRHDLLWDGKKIAGGAQWRDGRAAMHQGSLLLPGTPDVAALEEGFLKVFGIRFLSA